MKTKTYTAGANAERTAILAHVRRINKGTPCFHLITLVGWLLKRAERCNRKKGGLGR